MKKIKVVILFGGKSAEHEVSVNSAKNIYTAIDKNKYEVSVIGIDKKGQWHLSSGEQLMRLTSSFTNSPENSEVSFITKTSSNYLIETHTQNDLGSIDVIFPILHGPYGEDGSLQGFLKLLNVPFVGSGVLGSAVGMDKDISKRLLRDAGLPVGKFLAFTDKKQIHFEIVTKKLGLPLFIKPANLGSSIGVSKVKNEKEFQKAIETAFSYDTKILIEEFISGVEVECSVMGNENPAASIPGEITATHDFYSYEAKYLDENGAILKIPANLDPEKIHEVQKLAIKTFQTLCLEGMARVDFFYTPNKKFYINEVNTIPGFTNISMYPKLWKESGISNTELIDRLITLALEKYKKEKELLTSL
ncbi:MAG TPA: D-alanine--D-alanine ligase [Candidatus Saccharimonadales bacterium]|nr:D-alanine--D-alanine ligase [Candidatus Saccharimonadales bacterium]